MTYILLVIYDSDKNTSFNKIINIKSGNHYYVIAIYPMIAIKQKMIGTVLA